MRVLFLPEQQINDPAASHVRLIGSAMDQDALILAPSVLEGIGQDWKTVEGCLLVDTLGKGKNSGREPGWLS
jgi:hypothetical protein